MTSAHEYLFKLVISSMLACLLCFHRIDHRLNKIKSFRIFGFFFFFRFWAAFVELTTLLSGVIDHYRTLLPSIVGHVEYVRLALPHGTDYSIVEATEYFVRLIERAVVEVHKKNANLKIVLVGWGVSSVLNHRVSVYELFQRNAF